MVILEDDVFCILYCVWSLCIIWVIVFFLGLVSYIILCLYIWFWFLFYFGLVFVCLFLFGGGARRILIREMPAQFAVYKSLEQGLNLSGS